MVDSAYEIDNDTEIEDESEREDVVASVKYDITSYGIDFDVEGLCRRLRRGDIFIPSFQRSYVWTLEEASRFIESLLLGLPVPGIFLAKDDDSGKLLVIDGQQRLKSLLFFYDGNFNPENENRSRQFKLVGVQERFAGRTYAELAEKDRIELDDALIHATVVKQDDPREDDTSIYHIFERLNSGGRRLVPQEMRSALYPGPLLDTIRRLNDHPGWRNIYGKPSLRLRDQELILRFLALCFSEKEYSRPLQEFLTKFVLDRRKPAPELLELYGKTFTEVADLWWEALGNRAFRPARAFNAAVFDSMFVGLAKRIEDCGAPDVAGIAKAYADLIKDDDYQRAIGTQSTSEETSVSTRLEKATNRMALL
jgi:hypothetical protein